MSDGRSTVLRQLGWRLEALGYDVFAALLGLAPLEAASAFGGWLVGWLGPISWKQKVVIRNLELAFPEKSEAERRAIAREHWRLIGRTFAEFPLMHRLTPASGRVEVVGLDRLQAIAAKGEPAILVSGHLSNWEVMMAVIVASGLKSRVSYRPANNPYTDQRIVEGRRRYGVELFAAKGGDGTRGLISALQRGEAVALLNDQRDDSGVEAPFFGRLVKTAPGPARFALKFDARLVPMSVVRLKGARFRVTIHEPIPLDSSGDRAADLVHAVAAINGFIEARIRERPAEWLWSHRRWPLECYAGLGVARRKTQPLAADVSGLSESSLRRQGPA